MKSLPALLASCVFLIGLGLWWIGRSDSPSNTEPPITDRRPHIQSSAERLRSAMKDTDRSRRSARFHDVWQDMTAEEAAALAPELLANEGTSPFQNDWFEFLRRWGALDPQAALRFTDDHAGPRAEDWRRSIAAGWAAADPQAASEWWLAGVPGDRAGLGSTIIGLWAATDWPAATDWVDRRAAPADRGVLNQAIAYQLILKDPDSAQALVEACHARPTPPSPLEINLFSSLVTRMPLDWVDRHKELFPATNTVLERLARELPTPDGEIKSPDPRARDWCLWLAKNLDPGEAYSPLSPLPSVQFQDHAFQHWLAGDPEGASQWLADQPPSPVRDRFVKTLIYSVIRDDPEAGLEWLASLSPQGRTSFYVDLTMTKQHLVNPPLKAMMAQDGFDMQTYFRQILEESGNR
jgi:hypothetical protein